MKNKRLLVIILLSLSFCFVPVFGNGKVRTSYDNVAMDISLIKAEIDYMMSNPTSFLNVDFYYDPIGIHGDLFFQGIEGVDTENKICVVVKDSRDVFSDKSGRSLLDQFKRELEIMYRCIQDTATTTDMHADIVVSFYTKEGIPLGYFYQGEYHLWGK